MRLRIAAWLRREKARLVVVVLLVGLAGGVTMGIAAGARRTDSAPDRYTGRSGGDQDLVIIQSQGQPLDREIARLPGVASARSQVFVPSFLVSPVDGRPLLEPNSFAGDDQWVGTRLVDGRFTDPANPDEFTVNGPMAALLRERFGTEVGDRFQVVSYDRAQVAANFSTIDKPAVPPFTATLVGITESPTEFDDRAPVTVFSRSFLQGHPDVGVVQTQIVVELDGAERADVMDAVHRLRNGRDAYALDLPVVSQSARRAVRFQVTALWLVAALSLLAAAVVTIQVTSRALVIGESERRSMRALGWRQLDFAVEGAVEGGLLAVVASPLAALVAYALTSLFPLGVLQLFEPDAGARPDWAVTSAGAVLVTALLVATGAAIGARSARVPLVRPDREGAASWVSWRSGGMPLTVGARFVASNGYRSPASLVAGALGMAGLVGSVLVGLTLARVVERPERWGVNYDGLFGNPFTEADADIVTPVLDNRDVVAASGVHIGSITINGSETAAIGFDNAKGSLVPTVLDGRAPSRATEIGIGAEVARRLDVGIGDTVRVAGASGDARELAVVGIVVTPDSAGNGAAVPFEAYRRINPGATRNVLLVDFRDGAPASTVDEIAGDNFTPPAALPVPSTVRALERVTAAPFLLGLVLALVLVSGSAYVLASSFRARRRDLAILRALGSTPRQLRTVVHWQSSLAAAALAAIGVPLGIGLGHRVVSLLTDALGVVPGADLGILLVAATVCGPILVANALALLPGRRAGRIGVAELSLDR